MRGERGRRVSFALRRSGQDFYVLFVRWGRDEFPEDSNIQSIMNACTTKETYWSIGTSSSPCPTTWLA